MIQIGIRDVKIVMELLMVQQWLMIVVIVSKPMSITLYLIQQHLLITLTL